VTTTRLGPFNRRSDLRLLGLGAGTVAVAAAGGTTWLATTGGVFSTGTGPAHAAWNEAIPTGHPVSLVKAAILAANAHNTQPWRFTVTDDRIELFADLARTTGPWTRPCGRCTSPSAAPSRTWCWPGHPTASPPPLI